MPADIDTAALRELADDKHRKGLLMPPLDPATILSLLDQIDALRAERKLAEDRADSWKREAIEIQGYAVKDLKRAEAAEAQVAERDAEIARLRAALTPFSKAAGWYFSRNFNAGDTVASFITAGMLFDVRAALSAPPQPVEDETPSLHGAAWAALDYLTLAYNERWIEGQESGTIIADLRTALMNNAAPPQQAGSETGMDVPLAATPPGPTATEVEEVLRPFATAAIDYDLPAGSAGRIADHACLIEIGVSPHLTVGDLRRAASLIERLAGKEVEQ